MDWEFKENTLLQRLYRAGPWLTIAEAVLLLISEGIQPTLIAIWPLDMLDAVAFLPPMVFLGLWTGTYGLLLIYSLLRQHYISPRIWGGMLLLAGTTWIFLWVFYAEIAECGGWGQFFALLMEPFQASA